MPIILELTTTSPGEYIFERIVNDDITELICEISKTDMKAESIALNSAICGNERIRVKNIGFGKVRCFNILIKNDKLINHIGINDNRMIEINNDCNRACLTLITDKNDNWVGIGVGEFLTPGLDQIRDYDIHFK
jgi:hypothetical protein